MSDKPRPHEPAGPPQGEHRKAQPEGTPVSSARSPRFIQQHQADSVTDRVQAISALLGETASASPKHFYDKLGSHLFEAITELPEYYPTRTEAAIFAQHGAQMAQHIGAGATLLDLGAGNCVKAERLFRLLVPKHYIAIDISADFLHEALRRVQREHPQLEVTGLGLDFSASLDLPHGLIGDGAPVFFYPGSSIGNFTPAEAVAFLKGVHAQAHGGGLLIGVDLVKPHDLLQAAYDDAIGVTAAFNRNVLRRLNALIGSDFDPAQWDHVGLYNAAQSRVEMHLQARHALTVAWPGGQRGFAGGARLHTENSYKYTLAGFGALLQEAGFAPPVHWTDEQGWFAVFWAPAT